MKRLMTIAQKIYILKQSNNNTSRQLNESLDQSQSNQKHLRLNSNFQTSTNFSNIRTRGYYSSILIFLLIIAQLTLIKALIPPPPLPPACNSFPKIFGGNASSSYLYQIDVFNDYLAMAGGTKDNTLAGLASTIDYFPYVALHSISTGGKIYWAKAFTSKTGSTIVGVQFSSDGALLIAHSYSSSSFIVVFNVSSGTILSARSYSDGGVRNYNYRVKSMLVNSGASPMGYVLSNYNPSSCSGQHLLKFNPLQSSSASVWIKKTIGSNTNNCGHLGLVFGRNESLFYSFSWYNGSSTVSFLNEDGNSFWQYSTPDGNQSQSNSIKYKQIDSSTDMIIATSGSSYINYNRIISSSSSPYSVTQSQTYRDPTQNSSRQLYGLYIKDKDNAVSLIFDNPYTDLATIDFSAPSISYKRAFTKMSTIETVVFTSPTVYYAARSGGAIYTDDSQSLKTFNSYTQAVVYSSDMTATSCYQMATAPQTPLITMEILDKITSLPSSIYENSTVTFINDTSSYTTVDIDQSKITSINNWCKQNPFILNSVTQTQTNFSIKGQVSKLISIIPFSATLNCGSQGNTWNYTGFNNSNGSPLNQSTDKISVDSKNGSIIVQPMPAGKYFIKVIGILPDLATTTSANFTIIIENTPPVFNSSLTNCSFPLMSSQNYTFPAIIDPDFDNPIISVFSNSTGKVPDFITMTQNQLIIFPILRSDVKTHILIVNLTDGKNSTFYNFSVNVTNSPPKTTTNIVSPFILNFGETTNYDLPLSEDPEGLNYTTTINRAPSFVSMTSNYTKLQLNPKNCQSDFGNFTVEIKLEDQLNATTTYKIEFQVLNSQPPIFSRSLDPNQKALINEIKKYELPDINDPNRCPVEIKLNVLSTDSFITVEGTDLYYKPTKQFHLGPIQVTVILVGKQGLSSNESFWLTVYEPPKFQSNLPRQLDLIVCTTTNYSLPVPTDSKVKHSSGLPDFAKFNYPVYSFSPDKSSQLRQFAIDGELWNDYTFINFQLRVSVTNEPPHLKNAKISDIIVVADSVNTYNVSEAVDREGQKIRFEANERNKQGLPSFIKFMPADKQFIVQPTKLDAAKDYHIELTLIDNFNAKTTYPFVVTIFDPLKQLQNTTQNTPKNIQKPIAKKYLSAKIQSINPYGLMIIKFNEALDTPLFIKNASLKVNSTKVDIRLNSFQDEYSKNKSITGWEAINLTTTELTIQVNFSDPARISPKISQEDKIEITFKDGELFRSTIDQKNLPHNYFLSTGLPRQIVITKQIASISDMISGGSKAMTYLVIGNIALQLFMSFSMHLLWGMMNNLQLMGKMLKFNVDVPSNAYIFFKYVDEFLSMKAKFIEDYLEKFNQYIMKTTGSSGESDKDSNTSIIKNLGTIILGSVGLMLAMILTAILIKFSRVPLIMKITNALKNKLFYNSILRTGVQSYLQFSIIAFASLDSKKDNTTIGIGILFLGLTTFFLVFATIFLRKNLSQLSDSNFQQRFNSLYLNIDTDVPHSYLLTTIFLARRFLLGIVLSFADNHQEAQFFYMNFTSFLIIVYLVKVRPLVSRYLNAIEIFNEVILYGCTGLIWGMTDYEGDRPPGVTSEQFDAAYNSKQNQIGWAYIIMASTTIFITIGGIIINFVIIIRTKLNEKCQKLNKAVKEQQLTRSQEYELQKQNDSTMIQNKSDVSVIDEKQDIQEDHSQQEPIKLEEPTPYNFDSFKINKQQEQPKPLIEEEKNDSVFLTPQEYQSKFQQMSDIFKNIQTNAPQNQKKQLEQKDVAVAREEIFSILQQQSELTRIVYDLATAIPKDN